MVKFNQAILSEIQRFLADTETEKQKWHRSLKLGLDFCAARRCILAGFEYTLGKAYHCPVGRAAVSSRFLRKLSTQDERQWRKRRSILRK